MLIHGGCHCGNVAFELQWRPEPTSIPARACSCAFCRKHGCAWTACPEGTLRVWIADRSAVSGYAFGTKTAEFLVCTRCGVVPLATSAIDGRLYAVVNVNAFQDVDPQRLAPATVSFDGEDIEDRLARRRRNWIGDVQFGRQSCDPR